MREFNAKKAKEETVKWIRDWFDKNGKDCIAVVGISGGADSTIVAKLLSEALGKERVIGVLMPNGVQSDIEDSYEVIKHLDIKSFEINIEESVQGIYKQMTKGYNGIKISQQTNYNLPPRIRMSTLYAISQSNNGRVVNTCNLSETYTGWETRFGDSVGDFSPLGKFTKTEVVQIGDCLEIPYNLVHKAPSDGLCGKTDEESLGFTYEVLDKYIRTGVCEDEENKNRIDSLHERNKFKLKPMDCFDYFKGE